MQKKYCILFCFGFLLSAQAQSPWYEPNSWGDLVLQMRETDKHFAHTSGKYSKLNYTNHFYRRDAVDSVFTQQRLSDTVSVIDILVLNARQFNSDWLVVDNPEFIGTNQYFQKSKKPVLRHIYKYKSLFYTYHEGKSWLSVNPLLNLQVGPKSQWNNSFVQNTRGIAFRGTLEGKVGFYNQITENQWYAQDYIKTYGDSLGIVPGVGWWRPAGKMGFDFFSVRGYINTSLVKDHITASFGHDRFFIGNGYRSLILSDFAKEYLFVKLNTQLGPIHYQNIFAQLNDRIPSPGMLPGNSLLPKKYMAVHRISALLFRHLEIGATEMIVFDRDSGSTRRFEAEYMNPIIFYRAVESNLGSRDNALIALDAKLYAFKKVIFYGQLVLDEFSIAKVTANTGWWANKFGWQLGAKSTQNIRNGALFVQGEINSVKPYTYSHYRSSQSYTQYGQSLAHPLGANFREYVFRAIYQPGRPKRLRIQLTAMFAQKGNDSGYYSGSNYGGNLYKSNDTRIGDYNIKLLQGNATTISNIQLQISYMVKHNLYLDLGVQQRKQTGWQAADGTWINFGLRLNLEAMSVLY